MKITNLKSLQALARKHKWWLMFDYSTSCREWTGAMVRGYEDNIEVEAPTLTKCISSLYRKVKESV